MIAFKDLVPEQNSPPRLLSESDYEQFESVVRRANAWITESQVKIINIETVVLPNIHQPQEEGSTDPELRASGESNYWHQIVRIWYEH